MGKMGVSVYIKGEYEEFHALRRRENKANSKPIYFVLSTVWCVLRYGFVIPVKTGIQTC